MCYDWGEFGWRTIVLPVRDSPHFCAMPPLKYWTQNIKEG